MHDLQKGSISWLLFIHQSQYDYENIFFQIKVLILFKKKKKKIYTVYWLIFDFRNAHFLNIQPQT